MVILGNFKDNYKTATSAENKSLGFDLSATQCLLEKNSILFSFTACPVGWWLY